MSVPNPEQTASLLSLMLYSFLDPLIFLANRTPKLSHEQLPPLADYDYAKHLTEISFQVGAPTIRIENLIFSVPQYLYAYIGEGSNIFSLALCEFFVVNTPSWR
jgi:hypothetical protein